MTTSEQYFRALLDAQDEATKHMTEGQYRTQARAWFSKGYADGYKQALSDVSSAAVKPTQEGE